MRDTFIGYYTPTEDELTELWGTGLIIVDANILLNLYRYSPQTSNALLSALKHFSDRLWIPHQAAFEYHRNRRRVISQQYNAHKDIYAILQKAQEQLSNQLNAYRRHPFIEVEKIIKTLDIVFTETRMEVEKHESEHPKLLNDDEILSCITDLFSGKVGCEYSEDELNKIYEIGSVRYENMKPPGFSDRKKDGVDKFGDLVVWLQVIDKASKEKLPVIFITDDRKEDWWHKFEGKTIGPHPELVEEIRQKSGALFHMYQSDQFLSYVDKYLGRIQNTESISEIAILREDDEQKSVLEKNFSSRDLIDNYSVAAVLRAVGSMCKFVLESEQTNIFEMNKAARRVGVTSETVKLGLLWLEAKGLISILEWQGDQCVAIDAGVKTSHNEKELARLYSVLSDELDEISRRYTAWQTTTDISAKELFWE